MLAAVTILTLGSMQRVISERGPNGPPNFTAVDNIRAVETILTIQKYRNVGSHSRSAIDDSMPGVTSKRHR